MTVVWVHVSAPKAWPFRLLVSLPGHASDPETRGGRSAQFVPPGICSLLSAETVGAFIHQLSLLMWKPLANTHQRSQPWSMGKFHYQTTGFVVIFHCRS